MARGVQRCLTTRSASGWFPGYEGSLLKFARSPFDAPPFSARHTRARRCGARSSPRTPASVRSHPRIMVHCALSVVVLVALLTPAPAAPADIPVELRFDGRPFEPAAPADFTCFNATLARWVGCRVRKGEAPGLYTLERPEPGAYRMHVTRREAATRRTRAYEAQPWSRSTRTGGADHRRLREYHRPDGVQLRSPRGWWCATQPRSRPRHSWGRRPRQQLAWERSSGAEYRTSVAAHPCGGPARAGYMKETTSRPAWPRHAAEWKRASTRFA